MKDHEQRTAVETGLPFPSPTLVGCAIAVDRAYFMKLGAFDEGMRIWGGENIELGFRTWMCGGQVKTVVCSRVGHVFKVRHTLQIHNRHSSGVILAHHWGSHSFPFFLSFPPLFPNSFPSSLSLFPFPPVSPLEVDLLKHRVWRSAVSFLSGVCIGQSPSRNRICCISSFKCDIYGNNLYDFYETQLTKFRAVYTVNANLGP